MANLIKDTTDKLVYGHEGWIEEQVFHYHAGDEIWGSLKWGHDMVPDGLPRAEELTFKAFAPDGTQEDITVKETGKEHLDLISETDQEGLYVMSSQYDNCYAEYPGDKWKKGSRSKHPDAIAVGRYVQSSTTCISVGHSNKNDVFDAPLLTSLLPVKPLFEVGQEITLVLKTEGEIQTEADVVLLYFSDGEKKTVKLSVDGSGQIRFTPEQTGFFTVIARYEADAEGADYDKIHYTATHCCRIKEADPCEH